ncbi:MAG: hypothetical protein QXX95_06155, partial [Nitrososphaerales archaeon]
NYLRGSRGAAHDWEGVQEIRAKADEISSMLISKADSIHIIEKFHEACMIIRKGRLLCDLHKKLEPHFDVNGCHACEY